MAAGRRRFVKGDRAFRRLLVRLPDAIRQEMIVELHVAGAEILAAQRADAPKRTGALASALSKRVSPKTLRLRVGLIGLPVNRRFFYARIVEFGRKAKTVNATRRTKSGGSSSYQMRIRAIAPRAFVRSSRVRTLRDKIGSGLRKFWDRVLLRAASGVSDD